MLTRLRQRSIHESKDKPRGADTGIWQDRVLKVGLAMTALAWVTEAVSEAVSYDAGTAMSLGEFTAQIGGAILVGAGLLSKNRESQKHHSIRARIANKKVSLTGTYYDRDGYAIVTDHGSSVSCGERDFMEQLLNDEITPAEYVEATKHQLDIELAHSIGGDLPEGAMFIPDVLPENYRG